MQTTTMQQRRPHSTTAIPDGGLESNSSTRKERRMERREAKKLKRVKRVSRSSSKAWSKKANDPYFQLAFAAFTLLMLVGVTVFRAFLGGSGGSPSLSGKDALSAFEQKKQSQAAGGRGLNGGGLLSTLRGNKYVIPDSMQNIGDKSAWYAELRREYDTVILPRDDERSLKFVAAERNRQGTYRQAPNAQTPYDIYNCPEQPDENYPIQWPVLEVLENWRPDDANPHLEIYQGICVFDYRTERHKAHNYRRKEVPFIMRNDPAAARTAERWNHPGYLNQLLMGDEDKMRRTEYSPNNHFMYWVDKRPREEKKRAAKALKEAKAKGEDAHNGFGRGNQQALAEAVEDIEEVQNLKEKLEEAQEYAEDHDDDEAQEEVNRLKHEFKILSERNKEHRLDNWQPPTENLRMTYLDWLSHANITDASKLGPDNPHWYFRLIGCGTMGDGDCDRGSSEWLFDELTYFQPRTGDNRPFYLIEPKKQQGIHCRFGMKGVIAENHFDLSRNAINLLGGQRRYILGHPNQCQNFNLLPRGHPSARHSAVDWSDPDLKSFPTFADARVNEVVLQPGDVMYLPTNWFHYIISLELNFQCNTRSGGEKLYRDEITECGF